MNHLHTSTRYGGALRALEDLPDSPDCSPLVLAYLQQEVGAAAHDIVAGGGRPPESGREFDAIIRAHAAMARPHYDRARVLPAGTKREAALLMGDEAVRRIEEYAYVHNAGTEAAKDCAMMRAARLLLDEREEERRILCGLFTSPNDTVRARRLGEAVYNVPTGRSAFGWRAYLAKSLPMAAASVPVGKGETPFLVAEAERYADAVRSRPKLVISKSLNALSLPDER